jgi:hypothetical protein
MEKRAAVVAAAREQHGLLLRPRGVSARLRAVPAFAGADAAAASELPGLGQSAPLTIAFMPANRKSSRLEFALARSK